MMNERQQKQYDKINKFLKQFGAKIKEGEDYINSKLNIKIENKYNVVREIIPTNIKNIKKNNDYWTFDGLMSERQKKELEIIKNIANAKNGELISTIYRNTESKLEFKDNKGNIFFMTPHNIKSGQWSPYESGSVYNDKDYHLNELKEIAQKKHGKVISTTYNGWNSKMEFEDQDGNRFFLKPNAVKNGQWTPYKLSNLSEERCRQCIEFIFDEEFLNTWDIIKIKGKKNLQLDGFNKKLNIAFEYQGEQHYKKCFTSEKSLEKIKKNDEIKKKFCEENNIVLLQIKYFNKNYKKDIDFLNHVINEIKKYKNKKLDNYLNIEEKIFTFEINYQKIPTNKKHINQLEKIANKKGGRLISTNYIDKKTKLEFQDKFGNKFWARPDRVKSGLWSPYESKNVKDKKYHFNILKNIAEKNGGKLISTEYINSKTKLEFEDKDGNKFLMNSFYVKKGQWSPYELKKLKDNKKILTSIKQMAEQNGGKLISKFYVNSSIELEFQDKKGNRFYLAPKFLKKGQWSPYEKK